MSLLRDQQRACLAYTKVAEVQAELRKDYRIVVQDFGTNLRRLGLAAALSMLERKGKGKDKDNSGGQLLLEHLAKASVTGLGDKPEALARHAREIDDLAAYMLASRELMRLASWFNRAVQATFVEGDRAD